MTMKPTGVLRPLSRSARAFLPALSAAIAASVFFATLTTALPRRVTLKRWRTSVLVLVRSKTTTTGFSLKSLSSSSISLAFLSLGRSRVLWTAIHGWELQPH